MVGEKRCCGLGLGLFLFTEIAGDVVIVLVLWRRLRRCCCFKSVSRFLNCCCANKSPVTAVPTKLIIQSFNLSIDLYGDFSMRLLYKVSAGACYEQVQ